MITNPFTTSDFNSRAHIERDSGGLPPCNAGADFNSRAHMERDIFRNRFDAGGAYFNSRAHMERDCWVSVPWPPIPISIHAPTWSATQMVFVVVAFEQDFNSRAHMERDTFRTESETGIGNFNSRAHAERDVATRSPASAHFLFQFTRSRGARPSPPPR